MQVSTPSTSVISSISYSSLPAARKFHELNQAYELLLDPLRRLALDAKLRIKQARTERYKSYDNKRKNMVEELEAREQAFKKARVDKQKEEVERWQDTERIKEEGRRLREDKEREMKQREEEQLRAAEEARDDELEAPSLGTILMALNYGVLLRMSLNVLQIPSTRLSASNIPSRRILPSRLLNQLRSLCRLSVEQIQIPSSCRSSLPRKTWTSHRSMVLLSYRSSKLETRLLQSAQVGSERGGWMVSRLGGLEGRSRRY